MHAPLRLIRLLAGLFSLASTLSFCTAQTPQWIWHPDTNASTVYFRKTFRTPPFLWNARLTVSADDRAEIFLNGLSIAHCESWNQPLRTEVTVRLNQGENVIAIKADNTTGPGALLVHLNLLGQTNLVSDAQWLASTREERGWNTLNFLAAHWSPSTSLGDHGIQPWGDVLARPAATAASVIKVPDGFSVELLRSSLPGEGSWVCLAFDNRGRLIISPEGDQRPLLRVTLENGAVKSVEPIEAPLRFAMGLLQVNDTLYANARGPNGAGLYRITDTNHNDRLEASELQLLKKFEGGSEHGYHAITLGPDKRLYVLNGNGTKVPEGISPNSAFRNFRGDMLSTSPEETRDPAEAPSGYILRTDLEGKEWELWMGGLRNSYDFDFNDDGELFTFDSDMEWDWGTPWYRPTRVLHCVSGADFGWRGDVAIWPDYYPDSLPAVANVGLGSPTGVKFGYRSHFPPKYQRSLFIMDWSYGRILSVALSPSGASYTGTVRPFATGSPLNLTDLDFGPDGALYFITGGRGTQSGLYRITHRDPAPAIRSIAPKPSKDLSTRRSLENLHAPSKSPPAEFIWKALAHSDRHIRYAARIALEAHPLETWKGRALQEKDPRIALPALLALARVGPVETRFELTDRLCHFQLSALRESEALTKLRALQLRLIRHGLPPVHTSQLIVENLEGFYPAKSWAQNRELSRILLSLDGLENTIERTLQLLAKSNSLAEQIHYLALLRHVRENWTPQTRREFFSWWLKPRGHLQPDRDLEKWFQEVNRGYVDGAYLDKYLNDFRRDALKTLTPEERKELADLLNIPVQKATMVPQPPRKFVREWKMADLVGELERPLTSRNLARGRQAFIDAQCLSCHRFGNDGGITGPELTAVGSKYDPRSLLESILEPSRVINEQYSASIVTTSDGETYSGRVIRKDENQTVVEIDPVSGARQELKTSEISNIQPAKVSTMPSGLVNILTRDELLDLLAYLRSGHHAALQPGGDSN